MRTLKVTLLILVFALPLVADDKAGEPIVQPDNDGDEGCVECVRGDSNSAECGGPPTGAGWMNCEGGVIWLCDGYAGCWAEPNCGERCAIA